MSADLTSFRSLSPDVRERACYVLAAAFAEVGCGPSSYPGSIPLDATPAQAHKACSLAMLAVGVQPRTYEDWLQNCLASNVDRPEALRRFRRYFELHGVEVPR